MSSLLISKPQGAQCKVDGHGGAMALSAGSRPVLRLSEHFCEAARQLICYLIKMNGGGQSKTKVRAASFNRQGCGCRLPVVATAVIDYIHHSVLRYCTVAYKNRRCASVPNVSPQMKTY